MAGRTRMQGTASRVPSTFLLLGLAFSCLLTACSSDSNVESGNRTGTIHVGNGSDPQTLDPHIISSVPEGVIALAMFEGLVTLDPTTLEPRPGAAERWEYSEDLRNITFHLRRDGRWSNGDPLGAEDFWWSLKRGLSPAMGSGFANYLFYIEGAEAYFKGETEDFDTVGVTLEDSHTLRITLKHPTPFIMEILAGFAVALPVHRATVEAHGGAEARYTNWTRPENMVSNGPFVLKEWTLQRHVSLVKNENYWDADNVALNGIVFHAIENQTTEERMFRMGQLHITGDVPLSKIPEYRKQDNSPYHQGPMFGTYFLQLNTLRPPLDDPRVRQALAMSVNRELLVEKVLQKSVTPIASLTPPGVTGYSRPQPLQYNPRRARELLAEAGYPDGKGVPTIEFIYNTSESHRKILVALQQMWKDALGIKITLTNMEWRVYLDKLDQRDFQGARLGWVGGFLDPMMFLELFRTDDINNYTSFSNSRYDEIIQTLVPETTDRKQRLGLLHEAENLLLKQAPLIPIFSYNDRILIRNNVTGRTPNPLNYVNFKHIALSH